MMKNMTLAQAARTQSASGFAMPICGHVAGFRATGVIPATTGAVVRDRVAGIAGAAMATLTGGPRVTTAYSPGTSAWSPPTC